MNDISPKQTSSGSKLYGMQSAEKKIRLILQKN